MKTRILIIIMFFLMLARFAFAEPSIQIYSHAQNSAGHFLSETVVDFIITDPQGRKLGHDPRSNQFYYEFDVGYGTSGIDDISGAEASVNPIDGTYIIEVFGEDLMMFTIETSIYRKVKDEGFYKVEVSGVIDEDRVSIFKLTYNSDLSKPAGTVMRVATPSSLKQDITLSRKIGWIDNDGIMNSLLKKAEAIEASITKGKKDTAKNQLNAFINEVNAQKGKHISDKAAKILLEDAQYILDNLNK